MPRQCLTIIVDQCHPEFGFVPSLVVENEPGHTPMTGVGELAQPWYWGLDYDKAKAICAKVNQETFGITPAEASDIVASSIAAGNRIDAKAAAQRVEFAKKLGRHPDPLDVQKAEAHAPAD